MYIAAVSLFGLAVSLMLGWVLYKDDYTVHALACVFGGLGFFVYMTVFLMGDI